MEACSSGEWETPVGLRTKSIAVGMPAAERMPASWPAWVGSTGTPPSRATSSSRRAVSNATSPLTDSGVTVTVVTGSAEGLDLGTAFKSAQEGIAAAAGNTFTALYARYADLDEESKFQFGALLTGQTDVETMVSDLQALTDQLRDDDSIQKFPREQPAPAATPAA